MTRTLLLLVATGCLLLPGRAVRAVDYLRGDTNSDGEVTISDAHFTLSYLFRGGAYSDCLRTMDVDTDGFLNITDAVFVLSYLFLDGDPPAAPFPEPGPDEGVAGAGAALPCDAYDLVPQIEDPQAKLEVLDAVATGGSEGKVQLVLAVSSSAPLGGFSGEILVGSSVAAAVEPAGKDLLGVSERREFNAVTLEDGRLEFGFLASLTGMNQIPAGAGASVFEITLCLTKGLAPGDYPLAIEGAELIDFSSGRAIRPAMVNGTLTVLETVEASAGCEPDDPGPGPGGDCEEPSFSPANAVYSLRGARGAPGSELTLPFSILSDAPVQGYAVSVDYDEEVLDCLGVDVLWGLPKPDGFQVVEVNTKNDHPGSAGVDEGFIVGAFVFSFRDNCHNVPANTKTDVLGFNFRVQPETDAISTEVGFLDGGQGSGEPVQNWLVAFGQSWTPEMMNSFVFTNGLVDVLPEIVVFIRGDSNGDALVDISDAQATLGYLFRGTDRPRCLDAADSNDDGELNVSDPITTLGHLFLGGPPLPAPYPGEGTDPTEDAITCSAWVR